MNNKNLNSDKVETQFLKSVENNFFDGLSIVNYLGSIERTYS